MAQPEVFDPVWLDHPTKEEEARILQANSQEWRGALTTEAYLRREALLAQQDLTRDGGLTSWALKGTRASDGATVVLAACETLHKRALLAHAGAVRDVDCHGVASVFGVPAHRGRGFGLRLITLLAEALPAWKARPGHSSLSVLFSDIGKAFYARNGWAPFASTHVNLRPLADARFETAERIRVVAREPQGGGITETCVALPPLTQIHDDGIGGLCARDEELIRATLAARPADSRPAVAVVPDARTMAWHFARENFVAGEVLGRSPTVRGAFVSIAGQTQDEVQRYDVQGNAVGVASARSESSGAPNESRQVWAIWMRSFQNGNPNERKGNTLHILRICIEPRANSGGYEGNDVPGDGAEVQGLMAVLREAQRQAHEWNMEHVGIWNPSARVIEAARNLSRAVPGGGSVVDAITESESAEAEQFRVVHEREEDSITSLQFFDTANLLPPGFKATPQTLDWMENEKFEWC